MTKQLRNISRPKGSKVSGIGVYRPKRIVSNDEIAPLIDSSDQWIRERSGIIERRYANAEETVASMAVNACNEAIKDSGNFTEPESSESIVRPWHHEGLAVRPEHRMIGHTGFLIQSRRMAPGVEVLARRRRPAKGAYGVTEE